MKIKFKKKSLINFILSIILLINGFNGIVFAQDENNDASQTEEDAGSQEETSESTPTAYEDSPAYKVLGRHLTDAEEENYGSLDEEGLKNQRLHIEQRLVIVRALISIGEGNEVEDVLNKMPTIRKTFLELVEEFTDLKEKYGTVIKGVNSVYVSNNQDDEYAFNEAAHEAFETVFCKALEGEEEAQFLKYFKAKNSLTYSKMVLELQATMTDEVKKSILFKILNEIGRPDLKANKKFVDKILGQTFTCANLSKLLKEVK